MEVRVKKIPRFSLRETALLYVLISLMLATSVSFLYTAMKHEMSANSRMMQMIRSSDDFLKAVNYLSRSARSYFQNLEEKNIANYWSVVDLDKTREKIIQRLVQLGPTADEFEWINHAKKGSDALIHDEARAMRLAAEAAGIPRAAMHPEIANLTLHPVESALTEKQKLDLAKTLLFERPGEDEYDRVRMSISHFQKMIRVRFKQEILKAKSQSHIVLTILIGLTVLIPILLTFDIARRKKIEETLQRQTRIMQSILDNVVEGIVVADRDGKFLLWNPAAEKIIGMGPLDVSPQEWAQKYGVYLPDKITPFPSQQLALVRAIRGEEVKETETFIRNPKRPKGVWVRANARPLKDEVGNIIGGVVVFRDITELKGDEEKLKRTNEELMLNEKRLLEALSELRNAHEELQAAQSQLVQAEKFATIGKLAGMISHEFRNELGVMRNAAFFLKMKLKDNPDEKIQKHLQILEERIQETDRIIENIMTFAKTRQPQYKQVELEEILYASIGNVKIPKNIKVSSEIEPSLPHIKADEVQLVRAFVNLILNSVQAIQNESGEIHIKAFLEKDYICIHFRDTGPGIREEDKQHLFEPLFTTKARGGGLGLATAQLLIEGHGGTIDIESEWGKGTKVVVHLPFE